MKQKSFSYLAAGLIASLLVMLLTGATWGFMLITVILLISIINTPGKILSTLIVRSFFAFILTVGAYQLEAIAFAIAHINANVSWYVIATLVIVAGLWVYLKINKPTSLARIRFSKFDFILILPAILICGAYTARVILPSENNDNSIIRSITMASDDITHLSMFDGLLRSHGNLLINGPATNTNIAFQYQSYPMGWHLSAAVVASSINPHSDSLTMLQTAVTYFTAKMLSFFLVILSLTILVWQIAAILLRRTDGIFTVFGLYILIAFTAFFVGLPQSFEGFFSFFPVLMYLSLFASIAIELLHSRLNDSKLFDILLLACIAGSAVSWILTAPILIIAFAIIKLRLYSRLREIPLRNYIGLGIVILILLFQVWVRLKSHSNSVSDISAEGGITVPELSLFVATNIVLFLCLAQKKAHDIIHGLLALLVPLYSIMAVVLVYVSFKSQTLTYYFQKLEIVALTLLIPLAGLILYQALTSTKLLPQKVLDESYRLVLFGAILVMAIPGVVGYSYYANIVTRTHHYTLESQDAQVLAQDVLNKQYGKAATRAYFFYPESRPRNIVGSNISRIGFYNTPCDSTLTSDAYEVMEKFTRDIQKCAAKLPTIIIYTDSLGSQQLKQTIPQSYFDKKEVILIPTSA
jgi:hypothetical protein